MEKDDIIIYDFTQNFSAGETILSENISVFQGESSFADTGTCLGISIAGQGRHSITFTDEIINSSFQKAKNTSYLLRIWVNNPSDSTVDLSVVLKLSEDSAADVALSGTFVDAAGCIIAGQNRSNASDSPTGFESIQIPEGFCGWIAYPLNVNSTDEISRILIYGYTSEETVYYIDDICLTDQEHGLARFYTNPNRSYTDKEAAELITQVMNRLGDRKTRALNIKHIPECDPSGEFSGIQAYTYDGLMIGGQKTKVFAYIGIPAGIPKEKKVPGVVLVHGGGGHAFPEWVKAWTDRGYVAVAMDTTGYFPNAVSNEWLYGLHGIFEEKGYINAPNFDDMNALASVENMWMYHAIGQVLLANAVLGSFKEVNTEQIGLVGISWGSVISSLAIGYENGFAFAVPIYGSGYLEKSLTWMGARFASPRMRTLWSAQDRFDRVDIPVLWLCMNDDTCFSINANSQSYLDTVMNNEKTVLSMKHGWVHGHDCCWDTENYPCHESFVFADSIVGKGAQYTTITEQPDTVEPGEGISCVFHSAKDASVGGKLYYLVKRFAYTNPAGSSTAELSSKWQTVSADVDMKQGVVKAVVPSDATCYYMELTTEIDGISYITTSKFINLKEKK